LIPEWVKKKLGIHSPSPEMAKVAKWIPARVAQGVYNNIDYIKQSTDAMAKLLFLISNKVSTPQHK